MNMYILEIARLSGRKPRVEHIGIIYAFYRKMSGNIKQRRKTVFTK